MRRRPLHSDPLTTLDAPRRPIIGIALLPSAATLGNMLCGVVAVILCLFEVRDTYFHAATTHKPISEYLREFFPTYIAIGAYLIVAAMIFDGLDGRLARLARKTSEFGAQLDSIADIVSFGVAPVLLYLTILFTLTVPASGDPLATKLQWRVGMCGAMVFVACAAIRLARYNAENVKDESGQRKFSGLPTPAAAAAFVALILLHEDLLHGSDTTHIEGANFLRWSMGPIAFLLGMMMISRTENTHLINVYFSRERPPTHLIWILVALALWWWWPHTVQVVAAWAYVLGGLILTRIQRMRGIPIPTTNGRAQPVAIGGDDVHHDAE